MSNRFPMSTTGRVATDPELTTGVNGTTRMRFRIAVNDRVQRPDGQWVDGQTVFHDVVAFGESARTYADTFRTGDAVAVIGELRFSTYTTRDGESRTGNQIVATVVAPDPRLTTLAIDRTRRTARETPAASAGRDGTGPEAAGTQASGAEATEPSRTIGSAQAATWRHEPVPLPARRTREQVIDAARPIGLEP